jgi:hypothetical protein
MKRRPIINVNRLQTKLGMAIQPEDPLTLFEIQEKLGKGSYGSVYKVFQVFILCV